MKNLFLAVLLAALTSITASSGAMAIQPDLSYFRAPDKEGIHVFETFRSPAHPFDGLKVRVGGSFSQQFQALSHENSANIREVQGRNLNALYPMSYGFNLATANLNLDVQLADGIRMALESYMSSRHHSEFWVKGGYIQMDKLPFMGNPQWFADYVSVRIGHTMFNYGDQQFRRSDNGKTIYNPFVGNYIMDAFTTEIGGEVYVLPTPETFIMVGLTGGLIAGDVKDYGDDVTKNPSIWLKAGYDSQVSDDFRLRLTSSLYTNSGTTRNTLYAGDRAGSRYYLAMEPEFFQNFRAGGVVTASNAANRFTSGRFSPDFTHQITAFTINPFLKYRGLEFFGTYEMASGTQNAAADSRNATQLAGELIYRFFQDERMFMGARYNKVTAELPGSVQEISIDRMQLAFGWFVTNNMLVKLEYVNQNYNDFDVNDYRNGGKFNGLMVEASLNF